VIKVQISEQVLPSKHVNLIKLGPLNNSIISATLDNLNIGILQDEADSDPPISEIELSKAVSIELEQDNFLQTKNFNIFSVALDSFLQLSIDALQFLLINSGFECNLDTILQFCSLNGILGITFDSFFIFRGISLGLYPDYNIHYKILMNWDQKIAGREGFNA
jgi:hypothetical protein